MMIRIKIIILPPSKRCIVCKWAPIMITSVGDSNRVRHSHRNAHRKALRVVIGSDGHMVAKTHVYAAANDTQIQPVLTEQ